MNRVVFSMIKDDVMRWSAAIAALVLLSACGSSTAPAAPTTPKAPVVDQSFVPETLLGLNGAGLDSRGLAQTFTVGIGGTLSGADFVIDNNLTTAAAPASSDVVIQVLTTATGSPTSNVLGSGRIVNSMITFANIESLADLLADFKHVDFTPSIPVTAGQVLALKLTAPTAVGFLQPRIQGTSSNAYSRGNVFVCCPWQELNHPGTVPNVLFFRTYVIPSY